MMLDATRPKVFLTRRIPQGGMDLLRAAAEVDVWEGRLPPDRASLLQRLSGCSGLLSLLTDTIDAELMDAAPRLKVISNYAVGYDNIDIPAATERGILVTNTPGVLTETTADLAFALLLAAARRVVEADRHTRAGEWLTWEPMYMLGWDIHGATLGILGLGRIGAAMARRARGFDMRVLYFDEVRQPELEDALELEYCSLHHLLVSSDFVSVHLPLTGRTRGLLGPEEFAAIKAKVLVNTSRGEVVDESALIQALKDGSLAAAALDVFWREPLPVHHPLVSLPNVVLTPHIGSASVGTRAKMASMAARNLVEALGGRKPPHLVNPEVLSMPSDR